MLVYGAKHKELNVRGKSRSGGAFVALSDYILENDGAVYGCLMQDTVTAIHERAVTKEERDKFCGSKYIQSVVTCDIYSKIEYDLKNSKKVLFSGTPCQVKSMKQYLKIKKVNTQNLFLVDIACHGVPSPLIWNEYLKYLENRFHEKAIQVDFRNKEIFGWAAHYETIMFTEFTIASPLFRELFYRHYILRPSCYNCKCKSVPYESDITLADFWGIDNLDANFNDNKGVSLLLINTEKGERVFNIIKDSLLYKEFLIEQVLQDPLIKSSSLPENREQFWEDFQQNGIYYCLTKYANYSWKKRILDYFPYKLAKALKKEQIIRRL